MINNLSPLVDFLKLLMARSIYEIDEHLILRDLGDAEMKAAFQSDFKCINPNQIGLSMNTLSLNPGLIALLLYRLSRAAFVKFNDENTAALYSLLGRFYTGVEIYYSASIGHYCRINHGLGTVIGARCVIGSYCLIHQGVTIGDRNNGRPTIGNRVIIYAGAKILGNIEIGDGSIIGANAVVVKSVPPNSVAVGVPAKTHLKS